MNGLINWKYDYVKYNYIISLYYEFFYCFLIFWINGFYYVYNKRWIGNWYVNRRVEWEKL